MKNLTAIVLTKNEERDLPACLSSLTGFANLVVVDSGSTDRTCEIAARFGARVLTHPFASFAAQRNWALDRFPQGWTLFLDADEVASDAFKAAVEKAITEAPDDVAGFYCCWKMMLEKMWLRRSDNFPKWQLRLIRNHRVHFIDAGHGQKEGEIRGRAAYIREPYLHYGFSKGWAVWVDRHNRYSTLEAEDRARASVSWGQIFVAHASQRNRALKPLVSRLPLWPVVRFFYTYFLRGGFLEGGPGFKYCVMLAYYEYLIVLKIQEWRFLNTGEPSRKLNERNPQLEIEGNFPCENPPTPS